MTESFELTLEGVEGASLRVRFETGGEPITDDRVEGRELFAGRMLRAFAKGRVEVVGVATDDLLVADFHLLRDLAERFGIVATDPDPELICRNCGLTLEVDPVGVDPETLLDAPAAGELPPTEWARGVDGVRGAELHRVRVADARGYWRALVRPPRRFGPAIVRGLGIDALLLEDGRRLTDARAIAARLNDGSDALIDVLVAGYLVAQYPPRMRFPRVCPECHAVHDVPTPSIREGDELPAALDVIYGAPGADDAMPSASAFAATAERIRDEVFRERGVANIELVVDEGVPPVDDAGEPLMGSYEPIHSHTGETFTDVSFVIALYYRTFDKMFDEAPYDVEAEIRETIDHEVDHHLHHLDGYDPLDAEERVEARRDLERTFGRDTVKRAERQALLGELGQIGRFFFWSLLALALALAALVAAGLIE